MSSNEASSSSSSRRRIRTRRTCFPSLYNSEKCFPLDESSGPLVFAEAALDGDPDDDFLLLPDAGADVFFFELLGF